MMSQLLTSMSLTEFLTQANLESSPAWELIEGRVVQKPMPTLFHSRLQRNLVNSINERLDEFEAIQELRCIIPPYSPVPDIVVIARERLSDEDGPFQGAPDWLIEIRSPDQGTLDLQTKIIHCLSNGTKLAWLIDFNHEQVWVWQGDSLPIICSGDDVLPDCDFGLKLTANGVVAMAQTKR
ncbi:MAG: Uma2 family endonuclease [Phormidium sp. GEM2.Bin31]|nr:MAG: Uma2 family endonuclease [Phormidium sp. GEM2.Bin31]